MGKSQAKESRLKKKKNRNFIFTDVWKTRKDPFNKSSSFVKFTASSMFNLFVILLIRQNKIFGYFYLSILKI